MPGRTGLKVADVVLVDGVLFAVYTSSSFVASLVYVQSHWLMSGLSSPR
jgi:hypothetical protein